MKARLLAAIRYLYPDELTPTAKHILTQIIEEETQADPNRPAFSLPKEGA